MARLDNPFGPLRQQRFITAEEATKRGLMRQRRSTKRRNKNLEEMRQQKRFVKIARERGWEIQHQNNGASSAKRRIHLWEMGCTAGAADLLIFDRLPRDPTVRGLALEFKSDTGDQSKEQRGWECRITDLGWAYHVVRGAKEAVDVCEWWGLA
jgi:hypothetical protein